MDMVHIYKYMSEVGGLLRPGNLNGSCVRDPVAGLFIVNSAPVPPCPCPFGLVLDFVLRNELKSGSVRSWMIPGGSWMSSGEY